MSYVEIGSLPASEPASGNLLRDHALRSLHELPPFSPITQLLVASLAGKDVSFVKLGDLIEKDTVIAGNVLHLVNSALYARRTPTSSVRHAVSRLGVNKLRNAVLGMSIAGMWHQVRTPAGWSTARFNKHSASVAVLSDLLAQRLRVEYPEGAFIAGLLHDIGHLLIAVTFPEAFGRLVVLPSTESRLAGEEDLLEFTHPELSAAALSVWNLPEPIQQAVNDHHASEFIPQVGGEIPLAAVVRAADLYVTSAGASIFSQRSSTPDTSALQVLGLRTDQLQALLEDFAAESSAMSHFFA